MLSDLASLLPPLTALLVGGIAIGAFVLARARAVRSAGGRLAALHSRPSYHGLYALLWTLLAGLAILILVGFVWSGYNSEGLRADIMAAMPGLQPIELDLYYSDAKKIALGDTPSQVEPVREAAAASWASAETLRLWAGLVLAAGAAAGTAWFTIGQVNAAFRARNRAERVVRVILMACAAIAILTTLGIVLSLVGETLLFFNSIGWRLDKFLFGLNWSPLSGIFEGKIDADRVGAVPLFLGTLMIMVIAMLVAVPVGLFAAIYLSDFASKRTRAWAKPTIEILAGIPTVVYGFFAAITVAPFIRDLGNVLGLSVASESALAAGIVMGVMIIPFISSLSDDVLNAVPQSLRDGSYGLGATKAETIYNVVLPAALPGIVSAVLLGISRAIGETMIVTMAAGQGANLTLNPLDAVTTVTVQIVALITGDTEAHIAAGPAFTLGFTLFCGTLALNVVALRIVRRYREMYD